MFICLKSICYVLLLQWPVTALFIGFIKIQRLFLKLILLSNDKFANQLLVWTPLKLLGQGGNNWQERCTWQYLGVRSSIYTVRYSNIMIVLPRAVSVIIQDVRTLQISCQCEAIENPKITIDPSDSCWIICQSAYWIYERAMTPYIWTPIAPLKRVSEGILCPAIHLKGRSLDQGACGKN